MKRMACGILVLSVLTVRSAFLFSAGPTLNEIIIQYKMNNFSVCTNMIGRFAAAGKVEKLVSSYILGLSCQKLGAYDRALDIYTTILGASPYQYEVLNNMGACYYYKSDFARARQYFALSLKENPNYPGAKKNLMLAETAMVTRGEYAETDDSKPVPCTNPSSIYISLAWMEFYMGNPLTAINYLKKALKSDPGYVLIYNSLGFIYEAVNNTGTAIKYYKEGLKVDDEYPDLWNNLGISCFKNNQVDDAIRCFLKAIELNGQYPNPQNNMGFLYLSRNDYTNSIRYFRKAIEINIDDADLKAESCAGLAVCCFRTGDPIRAGALKKDAVSLNYRINDALYLKKDLGWDDGLIKTFAEEIR